MILPDNLIGTALPGKEISHTQRRAPWRDLAEQPWKRWRTPSGDWAVYLLVGNRLSETAIASIKMARTSGLGAVLVAPDNDALKGVAPHFVSTPCHVVCEIAGKGCLISPLAHRSGRSVKHRPSSTRIPLTLLRELANENAPLYLKRALSALARRYDRLIRSRKATDDAEHQLLEQYAVSILRHMGFRSGDIDALSMIRRIESGRWGGRRDHFFHSFQNYFFGLFAVLKLPIYFNAYRTIAKLHWSVDPFDIWFLTALWHDVGYGIERSGNVIEDIAGEVFDEDPGDFTRAQFLKASIVKEALRDISCLMGRLLEPQRAQTGWMPPPAGRRRTTQERNIEAAFMANVVNKSHGAASSLRLYSDYMPRIRRMGAEAQLLPKQAVLLACCSAPFHDWHFRNCVRERCGTCEIGTDSLPFAGLLAFVDSIQDDRRDLEGLRDELNFLERLLITPPANVSAKVNRDAIPDSSLLWKIVEARDVAASLRQRNGNLSFQYPDWLVK